MALPDLVPPVKNGVAEGAGKLWGKYFGGDCEYEPTGEAAGFTHRLLLSWSWTPRYQIEHERYNGAIQAGSDSEYFDSAGSAREAAEAAGQRASSSDRWKQLLRKKVDDRASHAFGYDRLEVGTLAADFRAKTRCDSCRGRGKTTCGSCHGDGRTTCGGCHSSGNCAGCHGTGGSYYHYQDTEFRNGTTYYINRKRWSNCGGCHGSGNCGVCAGRGTTVCSGCSGSGSSRCSSCGGHGLHTHCYTAAVYATNKRRVVVFRTPPSELEFGKTFIEQAVRDEPAGLLDVIDMGSVVPTSDVDSGFMGHADVAVLRQQFLDRPSQRKTLVRAVGASKCYRVLDWGGILDAKARRLSKPFLDDPVDRKKAGAAARLPVNRKLLEHQAKLLEKEDYQASARLPEPNAVSKDYSLDYSLAVLKLRQALLERQKSHFRWGLPIGFAFGVVLFAFIATLVNALFPTLDWSQTGAAPAFYAFPTALHVFWVNLSWTFASISRGQWTGLIDLSIILLAFTFLSWLLGPWSFSRKRLIAKTLVATPIFLLIILGLAPVLAQIADSPTTLAVADVPVEGWLVAAEKSSELWKGVAILGALFALSFAVKISGLVGARAKAELDSPELARLL